MRLQFKKNGVTVGCTLVLIGVLIAICLVARLWVSGGDLWDPDSYYHAWRILLAAQSFPRIATPFDAYINYPVGYELHWPPGFDYVCAALTRLFYTAADDSSAVQIGLAVVIGFSCLSTLCVFLICRSVTQKTLWGFFPAALWALWPIHIEYSRWGRIDHHVVEPVVTLLTYWLGSVLISARSRHNAYAISVCLGLSLASAMWLWPSALLPMSVVGATLVVMQLVSPPDSTSGMALGGAFVVAALLSLPLCQSSTPDLRWVLHRPSFFHITVLGGLATTAFVCHFMRRYPQGRLYTVGIWIALAVAVLIFLPIGGALRDAMAFGQKSGLWQLIREQRGLFSLPPLQAITLVTVLFCLFPAAWIGVFWWHRRDHQNCFFVFPAIVFFVLAVLQIRFLLIATIFNVVTLAIASAAVSRQLSAFKPYRVVVAQLVLFLPTAFYGLSASTIDPALTERNIALRWLRQQPDTPNNGLLTMLNSGQPAVFLARKPVVGSTLIEPMTWAANRDTIEFFTTSDVDRAQAILRSRKITWILAEPLPYKTYRKLRTLLGDTAANKQTYRRSLAVQLWTQNTRRIGSVALQVIYRTRASANLHHRVSIYRKVD